MATLGRNNNNIPDNDKVNPSQAQGAQIPLQNFSIPQFPQEASGLKALTLTSDLKLDEYQSLLSEAFTIPELPLGIESLTLELFTLGYPTGWLSQLADRLPNLKSLVIYSQLFGGVSEESQADAVEFFRKLPSLRALHLLDVFAQPGFFASIGPFVTYNSAPETEHARRGLMFLEINYTVQHSDPEFLAKIQATELGALIGPGLITLALNVSEADVTDDPEDPTNNTDIPAAEAAKDGILVLNKTLGPLLVKALTEETTRPQGLRVLNSTLFTLSIAQLREVVDKQKALMVLNATVEVDSHDSFNKDIISILSSLDYLEQVEIVANPSLQFFLAVSFPSLTYLSLFYATRNTDTPQSFKTPKTRLLKRLSRLKMISKLSQPNAHVSQASRPISCTRPLYRHSSGKRPLTNGLVEWKPQRQS
jgi:hypothetical protein